MFETYLMEHSNGKGQLKQVERDKKYCNYLNNVPGHYYFRFFEIGTLFKAGTLFKVGHYFINFFKKLKFLKNSFKNRKIKSIFCVFG